MAITWFDLVVLAIFLWAGWAGYANGLVIEVVGLVRLIVSIALAVAFGPAAGRYIQQFALFPAAVAVPIGIVLVLVVVQLLLGIVLSELIRPMIGVLHHVPVIGLLDRLGGLVLSVLQSVVLVALVVAAVVPLWRAFDTGPTVTTVQRSVLTPGLLAIGGRLVPRVEAVIGVPAAQLLPTLTPGARHVAGNETLRLHFPSNLPVHTDSAAAAVMLNYVNMRRAQYHLAPLVVDPALTSVARAHSLDMFHRSYFGHNAPDGVSPFDRLRAAGVSYMVAGENIAYAPNVTVADDGLWNSPEHRANILRPQFRRIGIGVVSGGLFEEMFTQDFIGP